MDLSVIERRCWRIINLTSRVELTDSMPEVKALAYDALWLLREIRELRQSLPHAHIGVDEWHPSM